MNFWLYYISMFVVCIFMAGLIYLSHIQLVSFRTTRRLSVGAFLLTVVPETFCVSWPLAAGLTLTVSIIMDQVFKYFESIRE